MNTQQIEDSLSREREHELFMTDNKKRAIVSCFVEDRRILFESRIPKDLFFAVDGERLRRHMLRFSINTNMRRTLEICEYAFEPIEGTPYFYYSVVLKTFWLRLIQRTWRRVIRERRGLVESGRMAARLASRERDGRRLRVPGLAGMM
jgi:hypothetical protein